MGTLYVDGVQVGSGNINIRPSDFGITTKNYIGRSEFASDPPGMAVLHSKDLVNWRMIGHVVDDLTSIGPEYNYYRMNRYGRGVWAGAIRFHKDKYWVYFFTPDEGLFMSTTTDPAGPWEPLHQVWAVGGWDDCCPFWDDDGQGYFVATNFADNYNIHLFKLSEDGKELLHDSEYDYSSVQRERS